jgi:Na+/proline symporter
VFPQLSDIQAAYPNLDPKLLGDDIAFPAMLRFLPAGFAGLMVGGLIAAASSTILTHLNWGASYLVHDFYRRFIRRNAGEKHYVLMGRAATVLLFVCSSLLTLVLGTAKSAFDIILLVGAGTGLLYLVRWFWWRVNAWCEIVAMVSSFMISVYWFWYNSHSGNIGTAEQLLITVCLTTICWLAAAYLAPATNASTLIDFFRKVRPAGPGWEHIRRAAGISAAEARVSEDHIPLALLGWVSGCAMIWSALFAVGNCLYGRETMAALLFAVFLLSGWVVIFAFNRLWSNRKES